MNDTRLKIGLRMIALVAIGFVAGCAGLDGSEPLPPDAPRVVGLERRDRDHERLVAAFGGRHGAPQAQRLLSDITRRLIEASDRPDESLQITISQFAGRTHSPCRMAGARRHPRPAGPCQRHVGNRRLFSPMRLPMSPCVTRRSETSCRPASPIKRVTENVLNDAEKAAVI